MNRLQPLFERIGRVHQSVATATTPLVLLATRMLLGHAFVMAGLGKLSHFESTVGFFETLGLPAPAINAGFVAVVEVVGGALLFAGLTTRTAAAFLASTMVVALATAHTGDLAAALAGSGDQSFTDITALVYLLMLGLVYGAGGGPLSVDTLVRRSSVAEPTGYEAAALERS